MWIKVNGCWIGGSAFIRGATDSVLALLFNRSAKTVGVSPWVLLLLGLETALRRGLSSLSEFFQLGFGIFCWPTTSLAGFDFIAKCCFCGAGGGCEAHFGVSRSWIVREEVPATLDGSTVN